MTALNKQALREAAQEEIMLRSVSDTSDAWQDEASPEAVLALLDELSTMSYRVKTLGGTVDIVDQQRDIWMGRCKDAEEKLEAAEKRNAELSEFLHHVKRCLVKNREYAPISHEEIDTLLGIRADGKGAAL